MIENIVRYLHAARVPFSLWSQPSEEPEPRVAHALRPGSLLVDTSIWIVDGRAVLACYPSSERPDPEALGAALGGVALPGSTEELPEDLRYAKGPIPPLGQLFGVPLVIDEDATRCAQIAFRAFAGSDYFEIPYDDFALLEQPRVASFASAGELVTPRPASTP